MLNDGASVTDVARRCGLARQPVLARARGDRAAAGAHLDRAVPDPSRPGHSVGEAAQAQRLHPLGAQPGDGAVADGRSGGFRIIDGAEAKVVSGTSSRATGIRDPIAIPAP